MAKKRTDVEKRKKDDIFKFLTTHPDYPENLTIENPEEKHPDNGSGKHTSAQIILKGNLAKGTHNYYFSDEKPKSADNRFYAWNAWNYIGSGVDKSRDVYGKSKTDCHHFYDEKYKPNFYQLYPTDKINDLDGIKNRYLELKRINYRDRTTNERGEIAYLGALNFFGKIQFELSRKGKLLNKKKKTKSISKKVGCRFPYPWQAHHLIPGNFFYSCLSDKEILLIRSSNYDINHGRNIIFLPSKRNDTIFHNLPYHCSGHRLYDSFIVAEFKKIKNRVEQVADTVHGNAHINIEALLHIIEDNGFKKVCSIGGKKRLE